MKKAFTLAEVQNKLINFRNTTKVGENSLPPRGRVGVRGQQAFTPHNLDSYHPRTKFGASSELVSESKKAFTLAEVLITLAIIGVVAAMAIPSVISNAQQQEFKTGLRKAVSVLNSAITMNIALDGETPYDNGDLFNYLQKHMSILKSTNNIPWGFTALRSDGSGIWGANQSPSSSYGNAAFYTTDGMRYEFFFRYDTPAEEFAPGANFHESGEKPNIRTACPAGYSTCKKGVGCGSLGLHSNPNNTTTHPCIITVDVNGDRKPYPANINATVASDNKLIVPSPNGKKVTDVFSVIITDEKAIPFGVAAQKAMYQAQK